MAQAANRKSNSGNSSSRKASAGQGQKPSTASARKSSKESPIDKIEAKAAMCVPDTRPNGRPTVYNPDFCQAIVEFMARGYSLTAFAGSIGVSRDTIYDWDKTKPEFSDALTRARAARTLYWERRLQIAGPDARAVIFALRNTCADEWKNDPEVSVTVNNEVGVDLSKPPEEWGEAELRAELEKRQAMPAPTLNGNANKGAGPKGKR